MAAMAWHDRRYRQDPSDVAICQITLAIVASYARCQLSTFLL